MYACLQEQSNGAVSREQQQRPLPDISPYLQQTGLAETRLARWLSMLCSQTYFMNKLTVSARPPGTHPLAADARP